MKLASALLLTGLMTSVPAFAEVDLSKLPPPAEKKDLTYEKDIQPILKASCINCHGGNRPRGGLRLDSLESALRGGEKKVITPGDSTKSLLVIAASQIDPKTAMPPKPRQRRGPGGPNAGGPPPQPGEGNPPPAGDTNHPPAGPGGGPGPGSQRPPPKPLTPEQVGLLRAWIDQGAK